MSILITVADAKQIAPGVWLFEVPPHQVRQFGETSSSSGQTSVLLLENAKFDAAKARLSFAIASVRPVNVGTSTRTVGIEAGAGLLASRDAKRSAATREGKLFGPGDTEFLQLARAKLSKNMAITAEKLLSAVRERSSGDLKRGKSRNFSETPDNFWYVIIQPQINELSITIRGPVDRFKDSAQLEVKDDRGNTRFKVRKESEIPAALDLIFSAIRKQ